MSLWYARRSPRIFTRKIRQLPELQAQVASQSVTAAALTLDAHMEKLRDEACQRGQLSAAIRAEVKRRELRRLYVKQVESGDPGEFARMSDDELRAFIAGQDKDFGLAKASNADVRTMSLQPAVIAAGVVRKTSKTKRP